MRRRRTLTGGLVTLAALLCSAPAAGAHATLKASEPTAEEVLAAAPDAVEVRFSSRVSFGADAIRVLDAEGQVVARATGAGTTSTFRFDQVPDLAEGSYVVAYRATDDHGSPVLGAFNFHVGPRPVQPTVPPQERPRRSAGDELADLGLAGTIVGAVALLGAGFVLVIRPSRHVRTAATGAAGAAAACTVLALAAALTFGDEGAPAAPPAPGTHRAKLKSGAEMVVSFTPPRVGAPRMQVQLTQPNGQPDFGADAVRVRLLSVGHEDLGPFTVELAKRRPGGFEPDLITFPYAGRWYVEVDVAQDEFTSERITFVQEVRP